jgi:hypothetical protein
MAGRRRTLRPRWEAALVIGLITGVGVFALLRYGIDLDAQLSMVFGAAFGLIVMLLVARWYTAASVLLSAVEIGASAFAVIVTIIAAVVGVLS